jgi:hypothetical protein
MFAVPIDVVELKVLKWQRLGMEWEWEWEWDFAQNSCERWLVWLIPVEGVRTGDRGRHPYWLNGALRSIQTLKATMPIGE